MNERDMTEAELDALFDAQRAAVPPPSAAFLARVADDASRVAAAPAAASAATPRRAARPSLWSWLPALGALGAPGGVVAAGLVGLWIGVAAPQSLPDPALLWTGADDLSAALSDDWYGLRDFDTMEWDDG